MAHPAPRAPSPRMRPTNRPSGGRHPLPSRERFAMWLSSVGFHNNMQAVVYDRNGANYCGRLWWMLKWAGHEAVAVLDGGLQAWQAAGGAIASGAEPAHFQSNFHLHAPLRRLASAADVLAALQQPGQTLIDARGGAPLPRRGRATRSGGGGTSRARSTARSATTSGPTGASSQPLCCAPNSKHCWPAAIRPPWSTSAAAA